MENTRNEIDVAAHASRPTVPVSVIIPCFNHGHYLSDAIVSVLEQSYPASELIVVDDGSTDDTAAVCRRFPEVRYVYQPNAGLAAARNKGLHLATGDFVCFLDADDLLLPHATETGVAALLRHESWQFVYGGYNCVTADRRIIKTMSAERGEIPYHYLLRGNQVGMHATVLYRRRALLEAGEFDSTLPACEDYDMLLRIARNHAVGSHGSIVAEYRIHGGNMSADPERMLTASIAVLEAQRCKLRRPMDRTALESGLNALKRNYGMRLVRQALLDLSKPSRSAEALRRLDLVRRSVPRPFFAFLAAGPRSLLRMIYHRLPTPLTRRARAAVDRARRRPPRGQVALGDLRQLRPIDPNFGFGRGQPIDRFYIEDFLARHAADVKGHVLEVGDNAYTRRFGGRQVRRSDVLHVRADAPGATIVGDLTEAPQIPDNTFDCIVLTQTLHLVYDMPRALATVRRALKPGGVLLLTVPGISQIDRGEWHDTWYWSLTAAAVRRLLAEGWSQVDIETRGNVLAATGFLHGLAAEDLTREELSVTDPHYQLVVAARAAKPKAEA